jgi:hypothetical protein
MYPSISLDDHTEPFDLQVARGHIEAHSTVNIYGYQTAIATSFIPVWENATAYTYPSVAAKMNLAGSAGDTASIQINGLDANYAMISETLTLNGATAVQTAKSYLRINSMQVTAGSATNPSGVVTLKDLTNTTIYAQINAGVGRTQAAIYTVPAGYTFFLQRVNIYTSLNGNNANFATYQNKQVSSTGVVTVTQQAPFAIAYDARRFMARPVLEKTDIQLQCKLNSSTGVIAVAQEGYLIKNVVDQNGSI